MLAIALVAVAVGLGLAAAGWTRGLVIAQPDQWLLRIRNGRLVNAGVGIYLWRWPGDVVARFSSTVQRVGFRAEALSSERVRVAIEGFILWSVSPAGEDPFRAFRQLGLVNLDARFADLKSPKHLLSTPQHHAFQELLAAAIQRLAATMPLGRLLQQEELLARFRESLRPMEADLGIRVDQVEVLRVRPADEALMRELSTQVEEQVRDDAARARLEAAEKVKQREIESATRISREEAAARRQQIEREHGVRIATEASNLELAKAVQSRQQLELDAKLDRVRREAEANRDAMQLASSAEEQKSQAVRDHELARLVAERSAEAFARLPLKDARWVSIGGDSPATSLVSLINAAQELAAQTRKKSE